MRTLRPRANFNQQVMQIFKQHRWSSVMLSHSPIGTARFFTTRQDFVRCGDETAVQGRFEQNAGRYIRIPGHRYRFGAISRAPHLVGTTSWSLESYRGAKVPWIAERSSLEAALQDEKRPRDLLGKTYSLESKNSLTNTHKSDRTPQSI